MKVFRSREEIRKALLDISSLDDIQRPKVLDALAEGLDFGGVSKREVEETVRDLKKRFHISNIDARNLLKLLK